jgi:predicted nucleic acid-binding protein
MVSKIFLDANCLLDLILQRPGMEHAEVLMQFGIAGEVYLYTTPSVLHIVSYYSRKAYSKPAAKQIIVALLEDLQIIDCSHSTAVEAANSGLGDLEDALQYYAAVAHGIDYFISADRQLKRNALPQLPVYTSKELLAVLA